jgi:O-methyltransferase
VYRGGAAIFMRAVLRAHNVTDRRVVACDTFTPICPPRPHWLLVPLIQAIGSIPSRWWRRKCVLWLQSHQTAQSSFPPFEDPSDGLVDFVMWYLRNPAALPPPEGTSLDSVRSRFAKYGLLDDQVVFLEGFFADTLPAASLEQAAVIRLDGDTYESTRDAISLLYPKLSSGGYCIIDDCHSYHDCERAVHEYRRAHDITEPIQPIDNLAVFWRKS